MSRRCHHGSARHVPLGRVPRRPATATPERQLTTPAIGSASPAATDRHAPTAFEEVGSFEESGQVDAEDRAPGSAAEGAQLEAAADASLFESGVGVVEVAQAAQVAQVGQIAQVGQVAPVAPVVEVAHAVPLQPAAASPVGAGAVANRHIQSRQPGPSSARLEQPRPRVEGEDPATERNATAPQLRRFIKSRAYVPMHELRRRFLINGGDDEVTPVDLERKRVFVGLPEREGRLLGELLRAGDIGYELSMDPISPIVVGVYPMRPVTRV